MQVIYEIFGYPLGYIMWGIYLLVKNYGVAIIIFTLITKALLFPMAVKQQKSTAVMSAFQPKLQALQKKYANNKEKLQEEQMKLYAEEGVNPAGSCLPMLVQFVVLFGVIDVVYRPLTHIMHLSKDVIASTKEIASNVIVNAQANGAVWASGISNFKDVDAFGKSYQVQLFIMQAFNNDPVAFQNVSEFYGKVGNFNMNMFGLDLGANPTWTWPTLLIPVLAGVSQLLVMMYTQAYQKKLNPQMQSMGAMNVILYAMPIISIFIARSFPMAVGFYWICQSVFSFFQQLALNKIFTPEKVAEMVKKDQAKKKNKKGKSYMERMMEKQAEFLEQQKAAADPTRNVSESVRAELPRDEDGNVKISKSMQKDLESKIISDARKRMEDKYKDEVGAEDEVSSDDE